MANAAKFMGVDEEPGAEPKIAILPVPYEATTSYRRGTWRGPAALLEASGQVEFFDIELEAEPDIGAIFHTTEPVETSRSGPEKALAEIERAAAAEVERGRLVVGIGGEHAITLPLVRASLKRGPVPTAVIFDAHSDLRQSYEETEFSHACVSRRLHELGMKLVLVGIRSCTREDYDFARADDSIELITAEKVHAPGFAEEWKKIVSALEGPIYLSFDVDGLDPSIMPGTGTPEPGGLLWGQACSMLRELLSRKKLAGLDICELAPLADGVASEFTAAKLLYKMLLYHLTLGPK